jgi:hypothetical protein
MGAYGSGEVRLIVTMSDAKRGIHPGSRGDAEFREDAIEVESDGAVREIETFSNFAVGQPLGSQLRDLELLRCEEVPLSWLATMT